MAEKEGIPYQTLINSALYKIATGQMVDQKDADLIKMIEKLEKDIKDSQLILKWAYSKKTSSRKTLWV